VRELHLEGIVRFVGVQSEMQHVYPALDVLVSSSHSEGMPLALMEGMACAIPVVATNVGGVGELIESEKTGLLAAPGNHESIARGILDLINEPARRRAMGSEARRRMVEHFSFNASAEKMANLLTSLAGLYQKESMPNISTNREEP
jgi:glycosyltransferase involved in cell wall biosynthesis